MPFTPAERARRDILLTAYHTASQRGDPPQVRWARSVWASKQIADATADGDMSSVAIEHAMTNTMLIADTRALDAGALAIKLAVLTSDILQDFNSDPLHVQRLAMCASALADAVVLGTGGPIELPAGALERIRDSDGATIAAWSERMNEADSGSFRNDPTEALAA